MACNHSSWKNDPYARSCLECDMMVLRYELSQAKADLAKAQAMCDDKAIAFNLAKVERDILLEVVKAVAYDDADTGFTVPENRCQAHHSAMAQDAMRRAYQANKDL